MSGDPEAGSGIFHRLMKCGWFMQPKPVVAPLAPRSGGKAVHHRAAVKSSHSEDLLVVLAQTDALPELLEGLLPSDWRSRSFSADELRILIKPVGGATVYDAALLGANVEEIDADELRIFVANLKSQWHADQSAELKAKREPTRQSQPDARREGSLAPRKSTTEERKDHGAYFEPRVRRAKL